jgi:osmotically-inducible protein OsmY
MIRRRKVHEMGGADNIRDAVEDQLAFDPDVDAAESDITVETMNGAVALAGTVPSYPQYLAAEAAARRVAGVRNLHNHLEVVLPPGDYRDDQTLTTTANDALTLNDTVRVGVEAAAANGDITLTGTVRDRSERTAAELLVAGLTGVRSVKNNIQIRADADQPASL